VHARQRPQAVKALRQRAGRRWRGVEKRSFEPLTPDGYTRETLL